MYDERRGLQDDILDLAAERGVLLALTEIVERARSDGFQGAEPSKVGDYTCGRSPLETGDLAHELLPVFR